MTKIVILADPADAGELAYRAVAGRHHSSGKTAGEALDALTPRLDSEDSASVVIVRHLRPDKFFSAEQLSRLTALMQKWREARETGAALPDREQAESSLSAGRPARGIPMTGTLGLLLDAKKVGLISAVLPLLDQLDGLCFRVSAATRLAVLKLAGEDGPDI